ncbi:GNVR domain-containing protein [Rhodohalobacter sp. 8-1]|uniref:GNVR domain-containing protein n=1 Tax=Rhodohalobacter sp. 8-1 TaxID=3131972 RepID=UPI0030EB995C
MEDTSKKSSTTSYYVKLVYRWRKFLFLHFLIVAIVAVVIALIIPKTFSSSATILPEGGGSIASAILPAEMTEGLGSAIGSLTGSGGDETNKIMSLLKSRELATDAVEEFELMERFDAVTIEDAISGFREMVFVTIDDELMIRINVNAKTGFFSSDEEDQEASEFAHDVATYIADRLDERYTDLSVEKASFERQLVEERFEQNKEDLEDAEEALRDFSLKNSLIALPRQIEAAVETAANLEAQIITNQIELASLRQTFGSERPEVKQKQITIEQAKKRLEEIKLFGSTEDSLRLFPSFQAAPDLLMEFVELEREREVQSTLYGFLVRQYEQLKLQEARQTPTLQYIDKPAVPTKRSSPTRSILVIFLCVIGAVAGIAYLISYELYQTKYKRIIEDSLSEAKSD